jgi:hypothetical protein
MNNNNMSMFGNLQEGFRTVNDVVGTIKNIGAASRVLGSAGAAQNQSYQTPDDNFDTVHFETQPYQTDNIIGEIDLAIIEKKARGRSKSKAKMCAIGSSMAKMILKEILTLKLNKDNIDFYENLLQTAHQKGITIDAVFLETYSPEQLDKITQFEMAQIQFKNQQQRQEWAEQIEDTDVDYLQTELEDELFDYYVDYYSEQFRVGKNVYRDFKDIIWSYAFKVGFDFIQGFAMDLLQHTIQKFKSRNEKPAENTAIRLAAKKGEIVGSGGNEEVGEDDIGDGDGSFEDEDRQLERVAHRPLQQRELRPVQAFTRTDY